MAKNGHNAKAIAHAKWTVWVKNKTALNMRKTFLLTHLSLSIRKMAQKKKTNIRKKRAF